MKRELSTLLQTPTTGEQTSLKPSRHRWEWLLIILLLVSITALHYLTSVHLLPYHTIYRSLYFLPIGMAAVMWGLRGGLVISALVTLVHLPYLLFFEVRTATSLVDNMLEIVLFNGAAVVIGVLADRSHHKRRQALMMRTYIHGVLTSLPIGVLTREQDGIWFPQNQAADVLVGEPPPSLHLPELGGYDEYDWRERPIGIHRRRLSGPEQTPLGEVMTVEDLSIQRRLAQVERQAALGRLAGSLAHEVRNPLGILRATAQLLATKLRDETTVAQYVQVLTKEADRIDQFIGELLAYAQPQPLNRQEINLGQWLSTLVTSCQPYAEQQGVILELLPSAQDISILADPGRLHQAVVNLVFNAIQASRVGQTVEVSCLAQEEHVCMLVRDHGPGIPPQLRSRVFDPFFTTREAGTGMGLSVVTRIGADHGGAITLEEACGGGTVARLCLPQRKGVYT